MPVLIGFRKVPVGFHTSIPCSQFKRSKKWRRKLSDFQDTSRRIFLKNKTNKNNNDDEDEDDDKKQEKKRFQTQAYDLFVSTVSQTVLQTILLRHEITRQFVTFR